jgi:DNA mismatch repair protein MSH5
MIVRVTFVIRLPIANCAPLDSIFGLYVLDSRPSPEFQFEAAKNRLVNLDLASDHGPQIAFTTPSDELVGHGAYGQDHDEPTEGRQGKLIRLSGWIDLDSRLTVCDVPSILIC